MSQKEHDLSPKPPEELEQEDSELDLQLPAGLDSAGCLEVLDYLKRNRGFDFNGYKPATLFRRLYKRMQLIGINSCTDYMDYLEVHPDEFEQLFNTILINVTSFFRDPLAWETLESYLIPKLLANHRTDFLRIWSAGCASGEEPYSIIMMLAERLGMNVVRDRVKLYATDMDEAALQEARLAIYSSRAVAAVPEPLLAKYFRQSGGSYIFNSDLRRNVIFGKHDLMNDAPISRVDLLTCRNTLMYFNSEVQTRILSRFNYALNPDGLLLLGKAEMLFSHASLFTPVDLKQRIFTKVPRENIKDRVLLMMNGNQESDSSNAGNESAHSVGPSRDWRSIFDVLPTAQLVIDQSGLVMMINREARLLFRLSDKDINRPFQDLEISYRPLELRSLIERAYREGIAVLIKDSPYSNVATRKTEGGFLDVQVAPVFDAESTAVAVVVSFTDVTQYKQLKDELQESNRELETAYEELQSTNEELETTNEELQSTIEELETTNEELQSTNEELETMNEELQSTNEELHAINDELRLRSLELNTVNTFLSTILSGLQSGVAVLDKELYVQIWNTKAEDLWGVRSEEAVGKHLLSLDIGLPIDQIKAPIRAVANGESPAFDAVLEATNRRGKQVECKVIASQLTGYSEESHGVLMLMEVLPQS